MSDEEAIGRLDKVQRAVIAEMIAARGGRAYDIPLHDEIRVKNPGKGRKADYEGSRTHAIHTFCYGCMGGSKKDAAECGSVSCALWPYRPGARSKVRPPGAVPTIGQYQRLLDAKTSDAQREAAKRNGARLRKSSTDDTDPDEDSDDDE